MNHLASSARQPGSLPLGARNVYALFRFPSQQLFFVSRKFFAATVSRFLKAQGAFMLPFAFEVNNFFRSVKLFVSPWSQSFFFNREERLCSSSLSKSTTFFHFLKLSFHREAKLFFFNREERLCSPSLQESTVIFVSAKILFACVSVNRFPLSRRGKLP